jgi:hypothetical protein
MAPRGPRRLVEPLRLVHHHPGRLRVRADALRDEPAAATPLRDALGAVGAVLRVEHKPQTGSLLVEYEVGEIEPDGLLALLVATGGFAGVVDEADLHGGRADLAQLVLGAMGRVNDLSRELTRGRTDLGGLVPAALVVAAAWSFARHPFPLRWDNLLYWAYSVFMAHNRREEAPPPGEPPSP